MNTLVNAKTNMTSDMENFQKTVSKKKSPLFSKQSRNAMETKLYDDCHKMNVKYISPAINESAIQTNVRTTAMKLAMKEKDIRDNCALYNLHYIPPATYETEIQLKQRHSEMRRKKFI